MTGSARSGEHATPKFFSMAQASLSHNTEVRRDDEGHQASARHRRRRLSSAATSSPCCSSRAPRPRGRSEAARRVVPGASPDAENRVGDLAARRRCRDGRRRRRRRSTTSPPTWAAWASSRTTRPLCMLSVLINTHLLHGRPRRRRRALLLLVVGVRLRAEQADLADVTAAPRGGRLPGDARGRLRLGEAVQRAHVPALPRGLRPRDARRPLPQRLRPARHLGRRPREGARRDLPQGRRGRSSPATTRSRSGATASRPAASCTSTTASTARG